MLLEIETGLTPFFAPLDDVLPDALKVEYPTLPSDVDDIVLLLRNDDLKVLWSMAKILGTAYPTELYKGYPFPPSRGTDLISVKDQPLKQTILSTLQYQPKKRIHMNEVNF